MATKQADEGIVVFELNGTIRFINTACARMHGYETSTELLGKSIAEFYSPEQLKSTVVPLVEGTQCRGMSHGTAEHLRKDGTTFPSFIKMTLVRNELGKALGFVLLITDITERKLLEERLRQTTSQAKELEKQIEQFRNQINRQDQTEQSLKQQADNMADANQQLQQKIGELEQSQELLSESEEYPQGPEEEVIPLDPEELKQLSEMARRLT
jgi:PAS domain S-box-containing protein